MRMSVAQQLTDLNSKLMGYLGLMSYRYCNICVKAEASSLLAFEQELNGIDKNLEDFADIYIHEKERDGDDVTIRLLPKQSYYIETIMKGMFEIHPEFKMTLEKYDETLEDDNDGLDNRYIKLVMPEVNDDRHDLLLNLIDVQYNACCVKMDTLIAKKTAEITKMTANDDPSALDEAKEAIEDQKKQYEEMRESLTNDKKKEVEDAYQYYLQKEAEKSHLTNGNDGKTSMFTESPKETEPSSENKSHQTSQQNEAKTGTVETKSSANAFEGAGQSINFD